MRRLALAALAVALTTLGTTADPPKPATATVKFALEANLMWVDVMLDGHGPFRMAVDTGASTTVVLPGPAKEKGLIEKEPGMDLFNPETHYHMVQQAKIGTLSLTKLKVAVMSVPQISGPADLMQMKADGVLGFNFIARFVTTIDYKLQTISFTENDYAVPDPELGNPGITRGPRPWFGVQCEEAEARFVKSNGYDGGLLVNLVQELSPAETAGIKEGDIIVDIGGTPMARMGALKDWLSRSIPGQKVVVTLIRQGEIWEKDVVVGRVREVPPK